MPSASGPTLRVTLVQARLAWEDPDANLRHFEEMLDAAPGPHEVVVLPEMFSTGFSMDAPRLAEEMSGPTIAWMREQAARRRCILAGSVIISEGGNFYNRLVWMQPNGQAFHYDKRHLFSLAGEEQVYTPGERRVVVSVKGFRILLQVCYDLRFPVWSRQVSTPSGPEYDAVLYVANWPERRALAWNTLLRARAMENQAYCMGVNRVGDDGHGIHHAGDSAVYDPLGETVWHCGDGQEAVHTVTLERAHLDAVRDKLRFWQDGDRFVLV